MNLTKNNIQRIDAFDQVVFDQMSWEHSYAWSFLSGTFANSKQIKSVLFNWPQLFKTNDLVS